MRVLTASLVAVVLSASSLAQLPQPLHLYPGVDLPVPPVMQQTPVYCWAASGEMIFQYYHVPSGFGGPSDQASIVRSTGGPFSPCWNNPGGCIWPAGTSDTILFMLHTYPEVSRMLTGNQSIPRIMASFQNLPLTESQLKQQIDKGQPVLIALNPSMNGAHVPEHAIVLTGYHYAPPPAAPMAPPIMWVVLNDPFPYFQVMPTTPYLVLGGVAGTSGLDRLRFGVPYSALVNQLSWVWTFYDIKPTP